MWRAARLCLLRWLRIFFLSRSWASSFALAPFKKGGGGPYYCYCYCCSCLEIGGRGVYSCYYCYCYYCSCSCYYSYYYYYCYYFCSPIMGKAPDIIMLLISSPLAGRALNIIIFFSPLVGRGINPNKFWGWRVLMFFLKFVWAVWRDSPSNLRLKPSKRAASLAYPEVVFLIICGVTPVIWVKVPRRGAALPKAKLRNIAGPSLISRVFRSSLARQAPWRPLPGTIKFIETGFL